MDIFSKIVFPVFGMLIILIALGSFFFPYGAKFKSEIQKINLLGVNLEISVITAIILGGLLFCGLGFYLNEKSYQKKYNTEITNTTLKDQEITKLNNDKHQLNETLNSFRAQSISYRFSLSDLEENTALPPAEDLKCVFYKNWDKSDSTIYPVRPGEAKSYIVTFDNLSVQQFNDATPLVYLVYLEKNQTIKRWVAVSFNPLKPYLSLKPDE